MGRYVSDTCTAECAGKYITYTRGLAVRSVRRPAVAGHSAVAKICGQTYLDRLIRRELLTLTAV